MIKRRRFLTLTIFLNRKNYLFDSTCTEVYTLPFAPGNTLLCGYRYEHAKHNNVTLPSSVVNPMLL